MIAVAAVAAVLFTVGVGLLAGPAAGVAVFVTALAVALLFGLVVVPGVRAERRYRQS
jgi:hypothetical protein